MLSTAGVGLPFTMNPRPTSQLPNVFGRDTK